MQVKRPPADRLGGERCPHCGRRRSLELFPSNDGTYLGASWMLEEANIP